MSKEKDLILKILSMDLIPIYRFGSFCNYTQEDFFLNNNYEVSDEMLYFEGSFACMSGYPLSFQYTGYGYNDYDDYFCVAGINSNSILLTQEIEYNREPVNSPSGKWKFIKAYDFHNQVKDYSSKYDDGLNCHLNLKNQCIVNVDDVEFIGEINILNLLESVENLKYKIISNRDIIKRICFGIDKKFGTNLYMDLDKYKITDL